MDAEAYANLQEMAQEINKAGAVNDYAADMSALAGKLYSDLVDLRAENDRLQRRIKVVLRLHRPANHPLEGSANWCVADRDAWPCETARALGVTGDDLACGCYSCSTDERRMSTMIVCVSCGNKRCPHATDHRNACTGSNKWGQPGSRYRALGVRE